MATARKAPKKIGVTAVAPVVKPVKDITKLITRIRGDFDDGGSYSLELSKGNSYFEFAFEPEPVRHCCGIYELGNFRIFADNGRLITKEEKVEGVRQLLQKYIDDTTEPDGEEGCYTTFFTTVDNAPCKLVDAACEDTFTLVKEFTNVNSGNLNKLYVSRN